MIRIELRLSAPDRRLPEVLAIELGLHDMPVEVLADQLELWLARKLAEVQRRSDPVAMVRVP